MAYKSLFISIHVFICDLCSKQLNVFVDAKFYFQKDLFYLRVCNIFKIFSYQQWFELWI